MNTEYSLTASEKIMMLLDGELPKSETGTLFYQIAQNDELQDELFGHLKIKNLYIDKEPTPSEDMKRKLFAGIGITSVGMVAGSSYIGQSTNYIGSIFRSPMFLSIASALSGVFITLFAVNHSNQNLQNSNLNPKNFIPNNKIESPVATKKINNNDKLSNEFKKINNKYPVAKSSEISSMKNISKSINNGNGIQNSFNEFSNFNINETKIDNKNDLTLNNFDLKNENIIESKNEILNNSKIENKSYKEIPLVQDKQNQMNEKFIEPNKLIDKDKYKYLDSRFALTFRSFSSQNIANYDVPATNPPAINNIAIGILYNTEENLAFGFEFGQENFLQEFKAISNLTEINLQQNRLAFWGGGVLNYKLSPVKSLAYMQPFGSLFLGGTNFGYITKQNVGLQYNISDKFSMVGSFEFTSLFSSYNNIWNRSHKYGASYGVIIKF